MAKRRFVVHLGLPHTGAGGLAAALAEHATPLAEAIQQGFKMVVSQGEKGDRKELFQQYGY